MHIKPLVLAVGCLSFITPAAYVYAQAEQIGEIQEITVTARKRQESILKVPVVQNVVTQETLENYQIVDLSGLTAQIPGLFLGASQLAIGPQISLRGIGTTTRDAGVDQSVSLNLDGLSLSQGLAYKSGLFDLEQVEVLRGPQSLFYGKNSPAGVISMRTADPGEELEVIARVSHEFEARAQRGELIVSAPLTETLGFRLASMISDSEGFFKNKAYAFPGAGGKEPRKSRLGSTESSIVRSTLVWSPSDVFDARLKLNYTRDDTVGDAGNGQLRSCPDGTGNPMGIPFFNPDENCRFDRTIHVVDMDPSAFPGIRNNGTPFIDIDQKFGTLEMNYEFRPDVNWTSVTGYYRLDTDTMTNGTLSGYAGPGLVADNIFYREDFTQEFRVDYSDFDSPVNYTLGVFYQDGTISNRVTVTGNTALGLPATLGRGSHRVDIDSFSTFGQLRYRPVNDIELSVGARWTDEERVNIPYNSIGGQPVLVDTLTPKIRSRNWSPEFTITYTPSDDLTLFASLKQGYKSGSFTITTPVNPGDDNSFGDEKVRGGEVGLKSYFMDRGLYVNLASYYYLYQGMQVGATNPAENGLPVIRTINAGEAEVYGVELDASYRSSSYPNLTLTGAINWNHARFTELDNVPCWGGQTIAEGCNRFMHPVTGLYTSQDLSGMRLVRAPDWQAQLGVGYELPVRGSMKIRFGAHGNYSSKYPAGLGSRADMEQEGVLTLDANISLSGLDDQWEISLIGRNLTNKINTGACNTLNYAAGQILGGIVTGGDGRGIAGIDEVTCVGIPGREISIRLTAKVDRWFR